MNTFRRILVGSSLVVLASAVAGATTLTATVTCGTNSGNTELSPTNGGEISCNGSLFNLPVGDTLSSIQLTINGAVISPSSMTLTNNTGTSQSANIGTDSGYNLDGSTPLTGFSFPSVFNNALLINDMFDVFAADPTTAVPAGQQIQSPVSGSGAASSTDTTSATFAQYLALFNIAVDTTTSTAGNYGGGNGGVSQNTIAQVSASVIYTYNTPFTGAPEPTTLFLMGSALVGVGLLRKRMKA
jgi:hypothetical protein